MSGHGGISEGLHSSNTATSGVCCPICGMPLRSCDLEAHYTQELDYLAKLSAALIVSQQNQHNVSIKHIMQPIYQLKEDVIYEFT